MTNIEDRNRFQNKGSKGLATTTQLYTAKIRFSQLAKNRTTRKASSKASRKELIASNLL